MMLPNTLPSAPPVPAATSAPSAAIVAPVDIEVGDNGQAHADYNLHPLLVRSLDHYASHDDEDERFHVS
jgi:hypothetical protein